MPITPASLVAALIHRIKRQRIVLRSNGTCPVCEAHVTFTARHVWLRDHFLCDSCGSLPRERALMLVLGMLVPHWKGKTIHESSPVMRGASVKFSKECELYIPSQFFKDVPYGAEVNGVRCENLERLTFPDESIDIHVTQDVIEHVFDYGRVFKEIARTLKPGGVHIFTVPIVNKHQPSRPRAVVDEVGEVRHLEPAVYHGNPLSEDGSLVTMDWGFDICRHIFEHCGLYTHVVRIDDLGCGIRAEYIEVLVTIKNNAQC